MQTLVLEGSDGAGKTTLAQQLKERFPHHAILHNSAPPPGSTSLFSEYYAQLRPGVIIDRLWVSEQVYGRLFRTPRITQREASSLFDRLEALGGRLVYCCPPLQTCQDVWKRRAAEEMYDSAVSEQVWRQYDLWFRQLPSYRYSLVYRYDWTSMSLDQFVTSLTSGSRFVP